jgi:broad specificity phosphatase PhoE
MVHAREDHIIAVSHTGPIKVVLFQALQLNPAWHWRVRIDPASLTTLAFTRWGTILMGCNDTGHLVDLH